MKTINIFQYLLVIGLILLTNVSALAQPINNNANIVIPPSPEAASLGKYGDIPVDYSRGIPQISIPIHTINEGPLSLPISLSYHASGIRVREMSSWVGLGWTLNAGGMISRTLQGIADEYSGGYYHSGDVTDINVDADRQDIAEGTLDGEPDIFSYSFPGYSGKFYFTEDSGPEPVAVLVPKNNLKIEVLGTVSVGQEFDGFKITTPDGTKYYFGFRTSTDKNYKEMTTPPDPGDPYVSGWYLVRVESYDSSFKIDLNYDAHNYTYDESPDCQIIYHESVSCSGSTSSVIDNCATNTTFLVDMEAMKLTSITATNYTANFYANTDRDDMNTGGKALDSITIETGDFCKKFAFSYDYFTDGGSSSEGKRLKLDQVQEQSCNGQISIPPYKFEYYDLAGDPSYFIDRFSKQMDHWGYYNGKTSNDNPLNDINIPSTTYGNYTHGSANRNVDFDKAKLATLKSIQYPTSGTTTFEFESNTYIGDALGLPNPLLSLESCDNNGSGCCGLADATGYVDFDSEEEINNGTFTLKLEEVTSCGSEELEVNLEFFVWNATTSQYDYIDNVDFNYAHEISEEPLSEIYAFEINKDYKFVLHSDQGYASFEIISTPVTGQENKDAGGLRIKRITHNDGYQDIIKDFSYNESDSSTLSSGKLMRMPKYVGSYEGSQYSSNNTRASTYFTIFSESSFVPLSSFEGYHIVYSRVSEIEPNNGRNVYTYNVEYSGASSNFPQTPAPLKVNLGKLESSATYKEGDNTAIAEKIITPRNNPYSGNSKTFLKSSIVRSFPCSAVMNLVAESEYNIKTSIYQVTQEEVIQDGVSKITTYDYDPDNRHYNPILSTTTNSNEEAIVTKIRFAHEMKDSLGGIYINLIDDYNFIGVPFEQLTYVDGTPVSGNLTLYANATSNGKPYPKYFYNYEMTFDYNNNPVVSGTNGWILRGTINDYNGKGQPTQFTQVGWSPEYFNYNSINNQLATKTYENYTTTFEYWPNTPMIKKTIGIDGQYVEYYYDDLMRKQKIESRLDSIITEFDYQYIDSSTPNNYIQTKVTFINPSLFSGLNIRETFQYLDNLGKPIQIVEKSYSESAKDVIKHIDYDNRGRPYKSYEVFEVNSTTGNFVPKSLWPTGADQYFTLTSFEASPMNRTNSIKMPDWDYSTTISYHSNEGSVNVNGIEYPAHSLFVQAITDPNNKVDSIYTDKIGRQVQVIQHKGSEKAITQYVHDKKNRPLKVLPPSLPGVPTNLIYQFIYDARDNVIAKKVPDQGWSSYLYDERNLLTYIQDAKMASEGRWLHTQYDIYGREIETGFINSILNLDGDQNSTFDVPLSRTYYDGFDIPGTIPEIYKGKVRKVETKILGTDNWISAITTYDIHGRTIKVEGNHHLNLSSPTAEVIKNKYDIVDNLIWQERIHTPETGPSLTILNESYFDHSGRFEKIFNQINGGNKVQLNEISYTAKNEVSQKLIGKAASNFLQEVNYQYLQNGYLWQMNTQNLSNTSGLPQNNYALPNQAVTSSNVSENDLFFMELAYDQQIITDSNTDISKNGNISQMLWQVRGRERQLYSYEYDFLDRLTEANYYDVNNSDVLSSDGKYNTTIAYEDYRGNIASITRNAYYWNGSSWSTQQIDNLDFDYVQYSNRLLDVKDIASSNYRDKGFKYYDYNQSGADYQYDNNGNLIYDPSRSMTIEYNYLDLPTKMEFPDCKIIEFIYDASGEKLSKLVSQDANVIQRQDYLGGIEYCNSKIEAIYHAEGRVYYENGIGRYEYNLTDHLGNVRLSFTDKNGNNKIDPTDDPETNEILSETHYYPFGMAMEGPWIQNVGRENSYLYNGKELNEEFGLNWASYGAREYDPSIGRWIAIDPLAGLYSSISPYSYVANNPISFTDPDGMSIDANQKIGGSLPTDYSWSSGPNSFHSGSHVEGAFRNIKSGLNSTPDDHIILNARGEEIDRVKTKGPDRYFVHLNTTDNNGNNQLKVLEVNSLQTIRGDLKEQNPWNGSIVDMDENELRKLVSSKTLPIEVKLSNLQEANPDESIPTFMLKAQWIYKESQEGGDIDFVDKFKDGTIYEINGIYYNSHEGLNYLWGASLSRIGTSIEIAVLGAKYYHWYAYNRDVKANVMDKYQRVGPKNEKNHNKAVRNGYNLWN